MENIGITIPIGTRKEDIKVREKIIKDFYAKWISENPEKKIWNDNLLTRLTTRKQEGMNRLLLYLDCLKF